MTPNLDKIKEIPEIATKVKLRVKLAPLLEELKKECHDAADMGFTGKITIHPDQIEIVNQAFTPSEKAIDEAHALIAAFEEAEAQGKMAFSFQGQMVDVPHLKRAQQIIALAAHISGQTS